MPYRINNNRIFIPNSNYDDTVGIAIHTKQSHLARKVLSFVLHIFYCCSKTVKINGRKLTYRHYFDFETFEAKVDGKILYVNRKNYLDWRRSRFPSQEAYSYHISEDFLTLIRLSKTQDAPKVTKEEVKFTESTPQPVEIESLPEEVNPQEKKAELLPVEKKLELPSNATELVNYFRSHENQNVEEWKLILAPFTKEVVLETFDLLINNELYRSANVTKKLYPCLADDQKLLLLERWPDYFVRNFPEDAVLLEKAVDIICANPEKRKQLFEKIEFSKLDREEIKKLTPLMQKIITKMMETDDVTIPEDEKNFFALDVSNEYQTMDRYGIMDLILEDIPNQAIGLCVYAGFPEFNTTFGLRLLGKAFKNLHSDIQQPFSENIITFAYEFFQHLDESEKEKFFSEIFRLYSNGQNSDLILTFVNCLIVATLRLPVLREEILKNLKAGQGSGALLMICMPTIHKANPILEKNLTVDEKKKFLDWAQTDMGMKDAKFAEF